MRKTEESNELPHLSRAMLARGGRELATQKEKRGQFIRIQKKCAGPGPKDPCAETTIIVHYHWIIVGEKRESTTHGGRGGSRKEASSEKKRASSINEARGMGRKEGVSKHRAISTGSKGENNHLQPLQTREILPSALMPEWEGDSRHARKTQQRERNCQIG